MRHRGAGFIDTTTPTASDQEEPIRIPIEQEQIIIAAPTHAYCDVKLPSWKGDDGRITLELGAPFDLLSALMVAPRGSCTTRGVSINV